MKKILLVLLIVLFSLMVFAKPTVEIINPNNGEKINSTFSIDFNVSESGNIDLNALLFYDDDANFFNGFKGTIAKDLNLESYICFDADKNNQTKNFCTHTWDFGNLAGQFYLGILVFDQNFSPITTETLSLFNYDENKMAIDYSNSIVVLDKISPTIIAFDPVENQIIDGNIRRVIVKIYDNESGIDEASIRIIFNGTSYSTNSSQVAYIKATNELLLTLDNYFEEKEHEIKILMKDKAGNEIVKIWKFIIAFNKNTTNTSIQTTQTTQPIVKSSGVISISAGTKNIYLEQGKSSSLPLEFENNSTARQCFTLSTDTNEENLQATLPYSETCLNKNEKTNTTLFIITEKDSLLKNFDIKIIAENSSLKNELILKAHVVGQDNNIEVRPVSEVLDIEQIRSSVKIAVKNNTTQKKTISFSVYNSVLMPYLDKEKLTLNAGQQKELELFAYPNKSLEQGNKQEIQVKVFDETTGNV
ncbi:MAG: hypothetical protein Q7K42_00775, partial [Candidatus Diapherotrites archaeon]|nr:hypothetical protein [Candidatus Diapherotrites archaeon]